MMTPIRILLFCLLLGNAEARSQPPASEYQVKAAFLFHFAQFVEWPAYSYESPGSPFIIGILGQDPFGTYLDQLVKGELIHGRPIQVVRYRDVREVGNCHILFINLRDVEKTQQAIESLKGKNILTVSDQEDFQKLGGIVKFFTDRQKIRFQINPDMAKAASLNISSKLMRLAEVYHPTE